MHYAGEGEVFVIETVVPVHYAQKTVFLDVITFDLQGAGVLKTKDKFAVAVRYVWSMGGFVPLFGIAFRNRVDVPEVHAFPETFHSTSVERNAHHHFIGRNAGLMWSCTNFYFSLARMEYLICRAKVETNKQSKI